MVGGLRRGEVTKPGVEEELEERVVEVVEGGANKAMDCVVIGVAIMVVA